MASLPATFADGLAVNSTTVFTTVPGTTTWSLYGVAKSAVNTTPSPILTLNPGYNGTGYLGASDNLVIAEPFTGNQGGRFSTIISCNPGNCASSKQTWYGSTNSINVCDPLAQECFVQSQQQTSVEYAVLGTSTQTTPANFSPVLNIAENGIGAAAGGYLYAAGTSNPTPVLQRVVESGVGSVSTLATVSSLNGLSINDPLIVTSTQVFMLIYDSSNFLYSLASTPLPNGVGNAAPTNLPGTSVDEGGWIAYWADDSNIIFGSSAQQWVSCPAASGCTGTPKVLADASQSERLVVGDAQAIYWINNVIDPTTITVTATYLMKVAR